mmetsp:Transcript_103647/g.231450  ORF Transcript_103647/g.231450 Transcript_103647/m.231450 type:complete len:391 (+) Transcript_103647:195-1367(+)
MCESCVAEGTTEEEAELLCEEGGYMKAAAAPGSPHKARTRRRQPCPSNHLIASLVVSLCVALLFLAAVAVCAPGSEIRGVSGQGAAEAWPPAAEVGLTCSYSKELMCPAIELLETPEAYDVAVEALMRTGPGLLEEADEDMVRAVVMAGFNRISTIVQESSRDNPTQLAMIPMNRQERDAVLHVVRLTGDPRVQSIGFEVAQAIRSCSFYEREFVKRRIENQLQPRIGEILRLRRELVPPSLQEVWGEGHQWEMTLDPENMDAMKAVSDSWASEKGLISSAAAVGPLHLSSAQKSWSVLGGAIEEGRALLDAIQVSTHLFRKDLQVPVAAASLAGSGGLGSELATCALGHPQDFAKTLFCPLKFGAQGVEALRAAFDIEMAGELLTPGAR